MNELKTCFKKVDYDLSGLLHYIEIGDIGLPDIQRPFVWSNAKVRDLFDSMYRGFPVGYLLFWENGAANGTRQIGLAGKQHAVPLRLIVDGQQRLTSLYAVFRGRKVLDVDYRERQIEVAFRPRDGKFEVADVAIRRDPEWIANISDVWVGDRSSYEIVSGFLEQLEHKGPLAGDEKRLIAHNLDRLFDLQKYPFTALEIAQTVDEEQVADIFVRINSEGVRLNQADFILTLMSVFWDDGRKALEAFCRQSRQAPSPGAPPSSFNHFIQPDPDQLLRVAVALGFQRGRLKSVYQVLRGKDLETGVFSDDRRDQQFTLLQEAQVEVLNLTYWHQFLSSLIGAGYRSAEMISSQNALVYAYAFYLIGRQRFDLPEHQLQRLIGRWFFASSLTGRYTSSPETIMDGDLNRLKEVKDGAGFARLLEEMMASELTNDFWTVTLPANLDSSSARNPELFAYIAAQNRLGAPVLFSHKRVSDLLDPSIKSRKKPLERHHLFPRGWLESQGVDDLKRINQVANFALLEWPDNIDISDDSPAEYVPKIQPRFSGEEWSKMQEHHALPENWHGISYDAFLIERRKLMAAIIRKGFESLKQAAVCDDSASMGPVDVVSPESTESWRAAQADSIPMTTADGGAATTETNDKEGANTGAGALSVHRQFQSKFWTAFRAYVEAKGSTIRCQKPLPQHWMNHAIGRSGIHLTSIVSTWNSETNSKGPEIRAEVYFDGPRAKQDFAALERQKESIDSALGFPVTWLNPEGKAMCRIYTRRDADFMNEALWPEQFEWLRQRLEAMHKVFAPIVQSLKLEPTE